MLNKTGLISLDFEQLKEIIPQRFPFIMLDRIIELEPGVQAIGLKNVTGNEWFYQGHFPKRAITPGAMLIEAIAQTSIVFLSFAQNARNRDVTYLMGSVRLRFIKPVLPGDQLRIKVTPIKLISHSAIIKAEVSIESEVVVRGEMTLTAKDNSTF